MTARWFTSDWHLGHQKISDLRGFPSIADHDRHIVETAKKCVARGDQLWMLGDISSGTTNAENHALARISEAFPKGFCEIHLIPGNHDSVHPMHRASHRRMREFGQVFSSVQAFARKRINGQDVILSHFPYQGDSRKLERYPQYRLRNLTTPLLHGHTHSQTAVTFAPACEDGATRQIHVGVDAWAFIPVHESAIATLLAPQREDAHG